MIQEYSIKDWNSFIRTICEISDHEQYRMWYRGQADYEWGLIPSVQRPAYCKKGNEQYMATNFMIRTMRLNGEAPAQYDRSGWLSLMQHYGLPTRLLDWSESPLVALYFALNSESDKDAALWIVNPMRLNQKMGYGKYVPPMNYGGINDYLEGAFDDKRLHSEKIIACHGIGSDLRMYVQQSDFTIHDTERQLDQILGQDPECGYLYKIRIPSQLKKNFAQELNLLGIHDSTVYPDMEHIAREERVKFMVSPDIKTV